MDGMIIIVKNEFPVFFEGCVFAQEGLRISSSFSLCFIGRILIGRGLCAVKRIARGYCRYGIAILIAIAIQGHQPVMQNNQSLNQHRRWLGLRGGGGKARVGSRPRPRGGRIMMLRLESGEHDLSLNGTMHSVIVCVGWRGLPAWHAMQYIIWIWRLDPRMAYG